MVIAPSKTLGAVYLDSKITAAVVLTIGALRAGVS
jgi:hypothetical protein